MVSTKHDDSTNELDGEGNKKTKSWDPTTARGLENLASTLPDTWTEASPFGPENAPAQFAGTVHYQGIAVALLTSNDGFLLVMYRADGNYSNVDVVAAADYLRQLGKVEGAKALVLGYQGNISGTPSIFVISAS